MSGDVTVGMIYDGFSAKARAEERASITYAFPTQGYVVWMDSVVLLKDAPNRDSAIVFMDFMLEPENIAAVSNYAATGLGVTGAGRVSLIRRFPLCRRQTHQRPRAKVLFVIPCDEATQAVYDQIWTNLKN